MRKSYQNIMHFADRGAYAPDATCIVTPMYTKIKLSAISILELGVKTETCMMTGAALSNPQCPPSSPTGGA